MIKKIGKTPQVTAKPFLRWAGGKTWLIKHLKKLKINSFNNYHEGFLGGASTFLHLNPRRKSFLSDLNQDLINTYKAVKDSPREVINCLRTFNNSEEDYYRIRERIYESASELAARFIYLNQTSFNGIYRVNLKGVYNVPYGFRKKDFLDEQAIYRASNCLQSAELVASDFDVIRDNLRPRDLVFLDPPYTVSHNHNGFIKYNEKLFSLEDQYRLQSLIDFIRSNNAYYILTNAAHEKVKEIFENEDYIYKFSRASLIGGINAERGHTEEYIFSNVNLV